MYPPTVKICNVREALDVPCIIISMPTVWYRRILKPGDLILTPEQRDQLVYDLQHPQRDPVQTDDEGNIIPAKADHAPRPIPVREIDLERYTIALTTEDVYPPPGMETKIAGKFTAGSGV